MKKLKKDIKIGIGIICVEKEKEIKENCEIYLNNRKIDFCYEYEFEKVDKNEIKIISKTPLISTNWVLFDCFF